MDGRRWSADGGVRLAFATWLVALHAGGVPILDAAGRAACERVVADPGDASAGDLLAWVDAGLGAADVDAARALAARALGDALRTDLGAGDRAYRLARIRRYQFGRQLPWLARVWERGGDGVVGVSWLVVGEVTDTLRALDPNPWNDVDEAREIPVGDFLVLWELDGCSALSVA